MYKHLIFAVIGFNLISCATIINGTRQQIPVASNPPGAYVDVDGCCVGTTPMTVDVARKQFHIVTLSKEGYHQESFQLQPVISGAVAGNIIAGGLIGWGVDAVSGAQYRLIPETLAVDLEYCGCQEAK